MWISHLEVIDVDTDLIVEEASENVKITLELLKTSAHSVSMMLVSFLYFLSLVAPRRMGAFSPSGPPIATSQGKNGKNQLFFGKFVNFCSLPHPPPKTFCLFYVPSLQKNLVPPLFPVNDFSLC